MLYIISALFHLTKRILMVFVLVSNRTLSQKIIIHIQYKKEKKRKTQLKYFGLTEITDF